MPAGSNPSWLSAEQFAAVLDRIGEPGDGRAWDDGRRESEPAPMGRLRLAADPPVLRREAVAQSRYEGSYSRTDDVISALGAADSAARQLMNASFVVQGALILAGALLLRPVAAPRGGAGGPGAARGRGGRRAARRRLPDGRQRDHARVRRRCCTWWVAGSGSSRWPTRSARGPRRSAPRWPCWGSSGTAATVFFLTGVTSYLGEGGTERVAAYVLPIGLALAGAALWRLGRRPRQSRAAGVRSASSPERAGRARPERDEALAAAARPARTARRPDGGRAGRRRHDDDRDPWAAAPRRAD